LAIIDRLARLQFNGAVAFSCIYGHCLRCGARPVSRSSHQSRVGSQPGGRRLVHREELAALAASDPRGLGRSDSIERFLLRTWLDERSL
jgi:hypothetical protein